MKVSVIGTGYVGLVSGVCLAEMGHDVVCVDSDKRKVDSIRKGIPPIFERGLEPLLRKHLGGKLRATTDLCQAVLDSELSLIAVGTPFSGTEIDLRFIKEVSRQIGEALRSKTSYHVVIVKSTVVPSTTDVLIRGLLEEYSGRTLGDVEPANGLTDRMARITDVLAELGTVQHGRALVESLSPAEAKASHRTTIKAVAAVSVGQGSNTAGAVI